MTSKTHIHLLIGFAIFAQASAMTSVNAQQVRTLCVVRELDEIQIPAKRDGLIEELQVRRGQRVALAQLLATLQTTDTELRLNVALAELKQAQVKAQNEGEMMTAKAAVDRAMQEQLLLDELGNNAVYLEKFRMQNNLQKASAELRTAESLHEQDQLMVDIKRAEVMVLENDIKQAEVFSPVNGIVKGLSKKLGEWVGQGEPILVVTRMDRLLAEGFLDSDTIAANSVVGASAKVSFQVSGRPTVAMEGLIVRYSAPNLELDGKFPVWVEFENRLVKNANGSEGWLIRPGMKAEMEVNP